MFMATNPLPRPPFLRAQMVFYLFPFLRTMNTEKTFAYLRFSSLGVVGALLKPEDLEVIPSLLELKAFPLFLRCLKSGAPFSKTVVSYIIQKIMIDELRLHYSYNFAERFYSISRVLGRMLERIVKEMVKRIAEETSMKLLKIIVRCFLRISESTRPRDALTICLPPSIKDATITNMLNDDPATLGLIIKSMVLRLEVLQQQLRVVVMGGLLKFLKKYRQGITLNSAVGSRGNVTWEELLVIPHPLVQWPSQSDTEVT
ncbi:hypothetical protein Nepgr_019885 [Nepenthes gracilis]|uniref:Uncharacterized protein n=1 Tax=Nepenthes gracilis TaxID=150966 RepID=A0AAD3XVH5_NEPGR|nr:hypothetical protein Nepgr_019885 [Nepenthes gracilis]